MCPYFLAGEGQTGCGMPVEYILEGFQKSIAGRGAVFLGLVDVVAVVVAGCVGSLNLSVSGVREIVGCSRLGRWYGDVCKGSRGDTGNSGAP